jgi:hypothetical protein
MNKIKLKSLFIIMMMASVLQLQASVKQVTLTKAGTLLTALGGDTLFAKITQQMKITGPINGSDIILMHVMQKMTYLDLQDARIEASSDIYYTSPEGAKYATANNLIGGYMFQGMTKLQTVILPSATTAIGPNAFDGCSGIATITIPDQVTTIGAHAFASCKALTTVDMGSNVKTVGKAAFSGCAGLTSVTLSGALTTIGDDVFMDCCSLSSVTLPDGITTIGKWAFACCSALEHITIPAATMTIGDYAFCGCTSLQSVNMPSQISSVGTSAFSLCSALTSVTLPTSLASVPENMFSSCTSLSAISFPTSVKTIGDNAFGGCTSLGSVYVSSITPPSCGSNSFDFSSSLFVPFGSKSLYSSTNPWSTFISITGYDPTGIDIARSTSTSVRVYSEGMNIIIDNASSQQNQIEIYTPDARLIANKKTTESKSSITVSHPGIYLVKIGKQLTKLVCK